MQTGETLWISELLSGSQEAGSSSKAQPPFYEDEKGQPSERRSIQMSII